MDKPICKIDGCERHVRNKIRGLCNAHYLRWRRHGDPLGGGVRLYPTPEQSFSARTEWRGDCLIWTGSEDGRGYGQISVNGKMLKVHRYAWEQVNGPIPEGMQIDHRYHCDRRCCNPEHLRLATHAENARNISGPRADNRSSGVRNVYPVRDSSRWLVSVRKRGKTYRFGSYATVEEASIVAERARKELFGEFSGRGTHATRLVPEVSDDE